MQKIVSLLSSTAVLMGLSTIAPLISVAQSLDPIDRVVAAGYMTVYADGDFRTEAPISRAELATVIARAFALDQRVPLRSDVDVQDVPASHWAYDEIQLVLQSNIMTGYREGQFYPEQLVNRAEAYAILAQAYGVFQFPEQNVNDILARYPDSNDLPVWARRAVATSLYQGFVNLNADAEIRPLDLMTRGDMAYALSTYLDRQVEPAEIPLEIQYSD